MTYSAVDDVLVARTIVDVYGDAPKRRDLAGELIKPGVILSDG